MTLNIAALAFNENLSVVKCFNVINNSSDNTYTYVYLKFNFVEEELSLCNTCIDPLHSPHNHFDNYIKYGSLSTVR